jgi:translation initiation factor IF-2
MTEQEPLKVYELAKELGIDSISLLDKLKSMNIAVKSHMSAITEDQAKAAREALTAKAPPAAKAKTSAVRKKAASTPTPTEPAKDSPAAPAKATARTRTKAAATTETAASPAKPATSKTSIIRRRSSTTGAPGGEERTESQSDALFESTAETQSIPSETPAAQSPALTPDAPVTQSIEAVTPPEEAAPTARRFITPKPSLTTSPMRAIPIAPPAPAASVPQAAPQAPTPPAPTVTTTTTMVSTGVGGQKRSVLKIVTTPQASARPSAPKPVITPRGAVRPGMAPSMDGPISDDRYNITKLSKERLDKMAEEEAAKKRGGRGGEKEIKPEDVRFADYRKKEVVFLPKRKKIPLGKELKQTKITQAAAHKRVVEMGDSITVQNLAEQLSIKAVDVVRKLMSMGQMATINQSLDFDTASLIAGEFKHEVKNVAFKETAVIETEEQDSGESLVQRPPVVTIMGHVDHGKTTLLDSIREANVAAGEAGGITQHIGAYTITKGDKLITFIDTPGHEAFTNMRARGANVTDIVILVVAADDGVMPQTREAISHAKAAEVPIIVAVNKMDKPGANPEKIKQVLAELNLLAEDWGGDTMFVPVSAIKKEGLDNLLESILLQAEVLDLKANPEARASGTVLEARVDKGRGIVASLLISRGSLSVGDPVIAGTAAGRVRAMTDHNGRPVKGVTPGMAVEVLGFEAPPSAGDRFDSPATEDALKKLHQHRLDLQREKAAQKTSKMSLDDLFSKVQAGATKELRIVLKADVFGSAEAIRDSLAKVSTDQVKIKIIHSATGGITESDVLLASASDAIIIGFNVRPETKARQLAEAKHIDIKSYSIIYELIDEIKLAMTGLLDKKKVEKFLGRAEVRQTFSVPKLGTIAGSAVVDGKILRGANIRLLRDSKIVWDGKLASLKRFKDDAKEVAQGYECGIGLEGYNDLKPGDIIEAYEIELVTPELQGPSASS